MAVQHEPYLPASEVVRFGVAILARLAIAVVVGLAVAKGLKLGTALQVEDVLRYGYATVGLLFAGSYFVKPVPWPEVDFGPEPETSLLDDAELPS